MTPGTSFQVLLHMTPLPKTGFVQCAGSQTKWCNLGDRLLSQHLPGWRCIAGRRLLDPERCGLAQIEPNAEFSRQAVYECT